MGKFSFLPEENVTETTTKPELMSTREDPRFQFHGEHRKEVEEYGTEFVNEHDGDLNTTSIFVSL